MTTTQNLDPEAFGQALRLLRLHGFALVYYGGDALHQAVGAPTEGDVIGKALNKAAAALAGAAGERASRLAIAIDENAFDLNVQGDPGIHLARAIAEGRKR